MYDAIVIGVGGMGSAAAYHLARRGARVLGLEQFDIAHALGSSHGLTRIIRLAYWEHPSYVPLLRRAYELWRELENTANEPLLTMTGNIDAGPATSPHVIGALESCRRFELPYEEFDGRTLHERFPGYRLPHEYRAIFQPDGGILYPERCVAAHVDAATAGGADIHVQERVIRWAPISSGVRVETDRDAYEGRRLVLTAGAWTGKLSSDLCSALTPERQVVLWTQPRVPPYFEPQVFPVFYIDGTEGRFYGFPLHGASGFKIGKYHHLAQATDPDTMDRACHPEDERVLRDGIRHYFPDADGPTIAMQPCLFTNTRDEHFVIDVLSDTPNVVVAAGFSGHGFKFCCVVGEILADLALDGQTRHDISLFSLSRCQRDERA